MDILYAPEFLSSLFRIDALTQEEGVNICFILKVTSITNTFKLTEGIVAKSQEFTTF